MRAVFMLQLLYAFGCLLAMRPALAAFLQECEGVIISRVPNPNPECSEYVYCNGNSSYYCNGDCLEAVSCYQQEEPEAPVEQEAESTTVQSTVGRTEASSTASSSSSSSSSSPSTTSSTMASTTSTTMASTTSPSTAPPPSNLQQICRSSGKNGVYPYPANDNYYYQCLAGFLLLQQCPQQFGFNATLGQCIGPKPYQL